MKADLREIYGALTRAVAEVAIDVFAYKSGATYDKAVACLPKDRETCSPFLDFPAEHWDHLRTSNPIESVFATVRHRTVRTKGALSARDRQTHGVQTCQRRRENMAAIERREPVAKGRSGRQIPKQESRSLKCGLTTPPDQPRHPKSCIAPANDGSTAAGTNCNASASALADAG